MSRRGLVLAGLAVALVATGCSSGNDGGSAGGTSTDAPTGEIAPPEAHLEVCAATVDDDDASACYAEAFAALMRDTDDPGPALEEIAVAAYTDPAAGCWATATGSCTPSAGSTPATTASPSRT